LPTSTDRTRPRLRRLGATLCAGLAAATLLSACSEAQVTRPTPEASPTPIVISTLPPIGFNHRYGNNPVTAADAFAMERALFARKEYWEVGLRADPAQAGYVEETDAQAAAAARARFTNLFLVVASESLPTLRALVTLGNAGQQQYCEQLVQQLITQGYTGLQTATVAVFFGESDRHATLSWTKAGGYTFQILDNNLNGALVTPVPSATPFVAPPSP
jgi:hypothetical protein